MYDIHIFLNLMHDIVVFIIYSTLLTSTCTNMKQILVHECECSENHLKVK